MSSYYLEILGICSPGLNKSCTTGREELTQEGDG